MLKRSRLSQFIGDKAFYRMLITLAFLALSALCMLTYDLPLLRYCALLAAGALIFWQRKRILTPLIALRKK